MATQSWTNRRTHRKLWGTLLDRLLTILVQLILTASCTCWNKSPFRLKWALSRCVIQARSSSVMIWGQTWREVIGLSVIFPPTLSMFSRRMGFSQFPTALLLRMSLHCRDSRHSSPLWTTIQSLKAFKKSSSWQMSLIGRFLTTKTVILKFRLSTVTVRNNHRIKSR